MFGAEDRAIFEYQNERKKKIAYVQENILALGYDSNHFYEYLGWQRENGDNLDSWTYDELLQIVVDYQNYCASYYYNNQYEENQDFSNQDASQSYKFDNQQNGQQQFQEDHKKQEAFQQQENAQNVQSEEEKNQQSSGNQSNNYQKLFEELKAKNIENFRIYQPTAQIIPTELNNKKIKVRVIEGCVKKGGLFSSNFLQFKIKTDPVNWQTERKDADFYFLRKILQKMHPYIIIPPLPVNKKKETDRFMRRRERYFTRFLQAILRVEELKSDEFLVQWLQNQDPKAFQKIMKAAEKQKYIRNMKNVKSIDGKVQAQMIQNSAVFCSKMTDFIDSYQMLYNEVIECAKEINSKSMALATTMNTMHTFLTQLSDLNRATRCQEQHEVYQQLSKIVAGSGNFIAQQGLLFKTFFGTHLKYHYLEHESFRDILKVREDLKGSYLKAEKNLTEKKEKLYRAKDFTKWGYLGQIKDIEKIQDRLYTCKEAAFTYMLQQETRDLELQKEELSFYSNQCLDETRRVGKDNGRDLIQQFIEMSQTQCSYINQKSELWSDFLQQFQENDYNQAPGENQFGQALGEQVTESSLQQHIPQQKFNDESISSKISQDADTLKNYSPQKAKQSEEVKLMSSIKNSSISPRNDGGSGGIAKIIDQEEEENNMVKVTLKKQEEVKTIEENSKTSQNLAKKDQELSDNQS